MKTNSHIPIQDIKFEADVDELNSENYPASGIFFVTKQKSAGSSFVDSYYRIVNRADGSVFTPDSKQQAVFNFSFVKTDPEKLFLKSINSDCKKQDFEWLLNYFESRQISRKQVKANFKKGQTSFLTIHDVRGLLENLLCYDKLYELRSCLNRINAKQDDPDRLFNGILSSLLDNDIPEFSSDRNTGN